MLRLTCFALFVALACGFELKASLSDHWTKFKSVHKKNYGPGEENKRKEIFKSTVERVLKQNLQADLGLSTFTLRVNEFADQTEEEFKQNLLGLKFDPSQQPNTTSAFRAHRVQAPAAKDWRPYLTPAKHQGRCGSCWSFAITGCLEGHYAIHKKQQISASEQNLIDCAVGERYDNHGCQGGDLYTGMEYIIGNGGINSDTCYPYEGRNGVCRYNPGCNVAQIQSIGYIPSGDENALLEAVGNFGPVVVAVDFPVELNGYHDGVYSNPNCQKRKPVHGVVVVGYGTENGTPYWLIRNSWGTGFGFNGYMKLRRGTDECGITLSASYPVV